MVVVVVLVLFFETANVLPNLKNKTNNVMESELFNRIASKCTYFHCCPCTCVMLVSVVIVQLPHACMHAYKATVPALNNLYHLNFHS